MKEKYFANAHLPKVVTNTKMRMRYIIVQVHVYYTDRTHTISSCDNVLSKPLSDGSVRLPSRGRSGDKFSFFNFSSCIQKQFPWKSAPSISCHTLFHYWDVQRYSFSNCLTGAISLHDFIYWVVNAEDSSMWHCDVWDIFTNSIRVWLVACISLSLHRSYAS